jgi:hypothetical protein
MRTEWQQSRRILWLPGVMILLSSSLWVVAVYLHITSPTSQDSWHTIPFNNHGVTHYLSWQVSCLPGFCLGLGVVGVLAYWILCRRIAARFGIAVDVVMGIKRNQRSD